MYVSQRLKSNDHSEEVIRERVLLFKLEMGDLSEEEKKAWWNKALESVEGAKEEKDKEEEAGAKVGKEEEMTEREMVRRGLQDAGVKDVAKKMAMLFDNT